jgi:N-acetylglucosaminyldiphosphoundecaprenol N-acetyl-beta-D-mannosaminyltransferase
VAARAGEGLEALSPGVEVVGRVCPPFRALSRTEQVEEMRAISKSDPNLVLVALGCPRQERLIADYFQAAPTAVWIGVGGTFDFLAGRRQRAPRWVQAAGLEWVARLLQDPRKLARRYLLRDIPFLARLVVGRARSPRVPG